MREAAGEEIVFQLRCPCEFNSSKKEKKKEPRKVCEIKRHLYPVRLGKSAPEFSEFSQSYLYLSLIELV